MRTYNKLPFKERKRNLEYSYNQTAREEELLIKREVKALEEEKLDWMNKIEQSKTDKEREMDEIYKRMKAMAKGGAE